MRPLTLFLATLSVVGVAVALGSKPTPPVPPPAPEVPPVPPTPEVVPPPSPEVPVPPPAPNPPPPVDPEKACRIDLGDYMFDPSETAFEVASKFWGFGNVDNAITLFKPDEGIAKSSAFLKILAAKIAADPFFTTWSRACAAAGLLGISGKLTSPFKDCWGAQSTPPGWTLRDRAGALLCSAAATQIALAGGVNTSSAFGQKVTKYQGPASDLFKLANDTHVSAPMPLPPKTFYYGGVASNLYALTPEGWQNPADVPGVDKFLAMDVFFVAPGEELAGVVGKSEHGIKFLEVIHRIMWTGSRNFAASVLVELG